LSLVDCASFEVMRLHGIRKAFAFDKHFREQGYELIP
jgi:predicted nucleic acid-binding protein